MVQYRILRARVVFKSTHSHFCFVCKKNVLSALENNSIHVGNVYLKKLNLVNYCFTSP